MRSAAVGVKGIFVQMEISFLRSPRFLELPPPARCLYISLWSLAVENRRETIYRPSSQSLGALSGLPAHTTQLHLQKLVNSSLVAADEHTITVLGARKIHQRLQWSDENERKSDCSERREEKRREEKSTKEPPLPPKGGSGGKRSSSPESNEVIEHFKSLYPDSRPGKAALRAITARLKDYEPSQLISVLDLAHADKWHTETGKRADFPYLMREDTVERFLAEPPREAKTFTGHQPASKSTQKEGRFEI